jgi:subtilisin-like proprotein convertase family protein
MKKIFILCFVTATALSGASAQSIPERVRLNDSGQEREFIIATDELASTDAQGMVSILPIKRASTATAATSEARSRTKLTGKETEIVLYEKDAPRNEFTRRILTKRIAVQVKAGTDAKALALSVGAKYERVFPTSANTHIFSTLQAGDALFVATALTSRPGVVSATPLLGKMYEKNFVPNDPFFSYQWHLLNTGQFGGAPKMDINVTQAWDSYSGRGVRIGIVDDGVQTSHPDLKIDERYGKDWIDDDDDDPNPNLNRDDIHGTPCASIVGMRLIVTGTMITDEKVADAMAYQPNLIKIKNNSWGSRELFKGLGDLISNSLESAAVSGRAGLGTIFVFAAGNGDRTGSAQYNSNYDGFTNSIYTIAVGAMDDFGKKAIYSEEGANLVVTAPSDGSGFPHVGRPQITTTDLVGKDGYNSEGKLPYLADLNYTNDFGGTSAAAPIVSGVVALMLEANPYLGWRDVQEILMKTAKKNDPDDGYWITNKAGLNFNHKYGAGLVDASAAVNHAKSWTNLPPQKTTTGTRNLPIRIPNDRTWLAREFSTQTTTSVRRTEHVNVTLDIDHPKVGELEIMLQSPSGTRSNLFVPHGNIRNRPLKWTFMTVRNWGESASGKWILYIRDTDSTNNIGTLKSSKLTIYGS